MPCVTAEIGTAQLRMTTGRAMVSGSASPVGSGHFDLYPFYRSSIFKSIHFGQHEINITKYRQWRNFEVWSWPCMAMWCEHQRDTYDFTPLSVAFMFAFSAWWLWKFNARHVIIAGNIPRLISISICDVPGTVTMSWETPSLRSLLVGLDYWDLLSHWTIHHKEAKNSRDCCNLLPHSATGPSQLVKSVESHVVMVQPRFHDDEFMVVSSQ